MSKFNQATVQARPEPTFTPVVSTPDGLTFEGGAGFARTPKGELFLLGINNFVAEDTAYEGGDDRDERYRQLVHTVALADPRWMAGFIGYLRKVMYLRSASLVAAAEAAHILSGPLAIPAARRWRRQIVAACLGRADEPGEFVAYWLSRFGVKMPSGVKRGVADGALRLYTEYSYARYGNAQVAIGFDRVLNLTHPEHPTMELEAEGVSVRVLRRPWQRDLFGHILNVRYGNPEAAVIPESLTMLRERAALLAIPRGERLAALDGERLRRAGMSWKAVAGWIEGPMTARVWEALIPSMNLEEMTRNLRNFDQAGISEEAAAIVVARLGDPEAVRRSRMLPLGLLSAYRAAVSMRWGWPLEQALAHSLDKIAALAGRTLVLIDTSGSMSDRLSKHSELTRWDAAMGFGLAVASRCESATVVSYSNANRVFGLIKGEALLSSISRFVSEGMVMGQGTNLYSAVQAHYAGHDRVVILTDEQTTRGYTGGCTCGRYLCPNRHTSAVGVLDKVPDAVPVYTWNLAGYARGQSQSGTGLRYTFGGLTDAGFGMIPLLESGLDGRWPWEEQ